MQICMTDYRNFPAGGKTMYLKYHGIGTRDVLSDKDFYINNPDGVGHAPIKLQCRPVCTGQRTDRSAVSVTGSPDEAALLAAKPPEIIPCFPLPVSMPARTRPDGITEYITESMP